MKICVQAVALVLLGISSSTTNAFTFPPLPLSLQSSTTRPTSGMATSTSSGLQLFNGKNNHDEDITNRESNNNNIAKEIKNIMTTTFMAASLWASPAFFTPNAITSNDNHNLLNEMVRNHIVADAKEMASGSGSRVNKDPESLLRYGLPIPKDKEVS